MGWLSNLFGGGAKTKEPMGMKMATSAMKETKETMKMESSTMKETKEVNKMVKDPVCGMEINEKSASAKSEYMGKTYYFCSPGCKKTFDADPAKYTGGGGHEMGGHGDHRM